MTDKRIENLNIDSELTIVSPKKIKEQYPLTENIIQTVQKGQNTVKNIIKGEDKRFVVVVGPCSIHDIQSAKEYAQKLKKLADELEDTLYIVMRVYFEKPRTTTGWQGLVMDPYLNESYYLEDGLKMARRLLSYIAELGLPTAGETLDIVTPQYIQDLFSYTAIGARTTESQSHRKMASGLTSAVGLKNGTNGSITVAINALESVSAPHNFVSINTEGKVAVIRTNGNPNAHLILRGGKGPNYSAKHIAEYEGLLKDAGVSGSIMVDCSHANSGKKAKNQEKVLNDVASQINAGNTSIFGVMIESNLFHGNQKIPKDLSQLKYGVSVTDECIGWEDTERMLRDFAANVKDKLKNR